MPQRTRPIRALLIDPEAAAIVPHLFWEPLTRQAICQLLQCEFPARYGRVLDYPLYGDDLALSRREGQITRLCRIDRVANGQDLAGRMLLMGKPGPDDEVTSCPLPVLKLRSRVWFIRTDARDRSERTELRVENFPGSGREEVVGYSYGFRPIYGSVEPPQPF